MDPNHESANCLAELSDVGELTVTGVDGLALINGRISTPPSFFLEGGTTESAILARVRLELSVAGAAPRLDTDL